jgi:hypothetical protein
MTLKKTIDRLDKKLESIYTNQRHLKEASNGIFGSAIRAGIDLEKFLDDIETKVAFDFESFSSANSGNFVNFIKSEYKVMAQPLIDITAGGNGGMASIGRGEFAISFFSNFEAIISKSGRGDIEYYGKFEEVKHNGGKLSIDDKAGNEVFRTFSKIIESKKILLKKKDFLPNRKTDSKIYSDQEKKILNGIYWEAMTGENGSPMSDDDWYKKSIERAFNRAFSKIDSLLVMNENNDFVRFFNASSALKFYSGKINIIKREFELRNNHNNAPSFYLGKSEVTI